MTVEEAGQSVTIVAQWVTVMREVVKTVDVVSDTEPLVAGSVVTEPLDVVTPELTERVDVVDPVLTDEAPVGSVVVVPAGSVVTEAVTVIEPVGGAVEVLTTGLLLHLALPRTPMQMLIGTLTRPPGAACWLHWASPRIPKQRFSGTLTRPPPEPEPPEPEPPS